MASFSEREWEKNPEKAGVVTKDFLSSDIWSRRWVVLSNGTLYFFKSERSPFPLFKWQVLFE